MYFVFHFPPYVVYFISVLLLYSEDVAVLIRKDTAIYNPTVYYSALLPSNKEKQAICFNNTAPLCF